MLCILCLVSCILRIRSSAVSSPIYFIPREIKNFGKVIVLLFSIACIKLELDFSANPRRKAFGFLRCKLSKGIISPFFNVNKSAGFETNPLSINWSMIFGPNPSISNAFLEANQESLFLCLAPHFLFEQ